MLNQCFYSYFRFADKNIMTALFTYTLISTWMRHMLTSMQLNHGNISGTCQIKFNFPMVQCYSRLSSLTVFLFPLTKNTDSRLHAIFSAIKSTLPET